MSTRTNPQHVIIHHNGRNILSLPRELRPPVWWSSHSGNTNLSEYSLYSHSAWSVAQAIESYLNSPVDNERLSSICRYNVMRRGTWLIPEDNALLTEYLRIFDKVFFGGALTSRNLCYIVFEYMDHELYGDCTTHQNIDFPLINRHFECRIRIRNVSCEYAFRDTRVRLNHYVRVVFHEAIHAIFGLYVCQYCDGCRRDAEYNLEHKGHGRAWQNVAVILEDRVKLMRWDDMDLLRQRSLWTCSVKYLAECTEDELWRWRLQRYPVSRFTSDEISPAEFIAFLKREEVLDMHFGG